MKKLLAILIAVEMILMSSGIASAQENRDTDDPETYTGVIFSTEEEKLSPEEQQMVDAKIKESEELSNRPRARSSTKISIPGTFTMYPQETNYYCVPACVQSVLHYLTGETYSQLVIARDMGTVFGVGTQNSKIAPYLREKQSFTYIQTHKPFQSVMCDHLYSTVAEHKKPALMTIVNPSGFGWYYPTNGHCLVVNAVYSDNSKVQFADPLGGSQPDLPYFYIKSSYTASTVCNDVIW